MNNEPIIKRKKFNFRSQYIYNAIILLVLTIGVAYAFVFFLHNEPGATANLKSSLVTVEVSEEGTISLTDATPVTDEVGVTGVSKVITVTNTSSIDALLKISLNPDDSNTISTENIRYGLYINGILKKIDTVGSDNIIYDGLLLAGETVEYEVYLWIDYYYTEGGTSFSGTFVVETGEAVMTIADYVTKFVGKDKEIYAINSSGAVSTDGSDIREYRYSGLDADNYVWFNCQDGYTSGSEKCELWRIVGSFDVKANGYANSYQRVKLVREELLDSQVFGTNNTYSGSNLDTYLNETYYNSLTSAAKKMIVDGEWSVGSSALTNTPNTSLTSEITSKVYKKIGLLSASDLGYATSTDHYTKALNNADLYTNSWLKGSSYYTLTPITNSTTNVIGDNATSITSLDTATATGIKPTVYLMPNVYVKGGNGSIDKPYELNYVDEVEHYSNIKVVGYITYDVNGGDVDTPSKQAIFADGSTVINAGFDNTSFQGWATSADGEVVYQKGDALTETSDITLYAIWQQDELLVDKITSTMSLTTADVDGTRFVYGETVDNNYVWYSGKLWRIVSIDNNGNVKLVTQGNMTAINWIGPNAADLTDYSISQIRTWLNNEFLPTLYNRDNLLVNHVWDYTTYESFPTAKLETTASVTGKVGLLNIYEYKMTSSTGASGVENNNLSYSIIPLVITGGDEVEQNNIDSFLNNGYNWWTMSPETSGSMVWCVDYDGSDECSISSLSESGVRPSINLKSGITILDGIGEKTDPYIIEGDKETGTTSELLSNRISGEYINFDNTKYRIVGIETINGQQLTKVTMADYDENKKSVLTTSITFGSTATYSTSEGIGKYLLDWYNATSENDTEGTYTGLYISDTYKKMIATSGEDSDGVYWWIGPTGGTHYDYTESKTGTTVETPMGLGYYGEMFSSQFGEGFDSSTVIWLMTNYNGSFVWYVNSYCGVGNSTLTASYGARPSFYLKSDVKITGGTGQPGSPYEISQ